MDKGGHRGLHSGLTSSSNYFQARKKEAVLGGLIKFVAIYSSTNFRQPRFLICSLLNAINAWSENLLKYFNLL